MVYLGIKYLLPVVMPFLLGLSIAAVVQRPSELLAGRIPRLSQKWCCVILTVCLLAIAFMLVIAVCCSLVEGAMSFCPGIPDHLSTAQTVISQAAQRAGGGSAWGRFVNFAALALEWCIGFVSENYQQYLPSVLRHSTQFIGRLPSFLTAMVFTVLSALFACGEFDRIKRTVKQYLPPRVERTAAFLIRTTARTVTLLLKTYGTLMLMTFGELTLGFLLMRLMGYNIGNILVSAFIISLIDILPILGTGTVLVPWGLFEILTGNGTLGIMLLMLFAVIGLVRNITEPRCMGSNLELHPFFTLAGVYIGARLFGAVGIVILPLAMIIARSAWRSKNAADPNIGGTLLSMRNS